MKYTVKRFRAGEDMIDPVETSQGTIRIKANGVTFAVVDANGKVAVQPHPLTSAPTRQTFARKYAAQMQADWMNENDR